MATKRLRSRTLVIGLVAGFVVVLVALIGAGIWAIFWIADNIGAPGPGATGSGPCTSTDAVNIELVFTDGKSVHACTRDRPVCRSESVQDSPQGFFTLHNQLRSPTRRYILFIRSGIAVKPDMPEQTLKVNPQAFMPDQIGSTMGSSVVDIEITPRDPYDQTYTPYAGSVILTSSHGVVHGTIDARFNYGSLASATGVFACTI
jgi:hypothetical protein